MPSTGINRFNGKALTDLDHVRQSAAVIFSTRIGSRVMRRTFGANVPPLLGQLLEGPTLVRFFAAIHLGLALWEPRLRSLRTSFPKGQNDPDQMRVGKMGLRVQTKYYPNALQGDFTSDVIDIDL